MDTPTTHALDRSLERLIQALGPLQPPQTPEPLSDQALATLWQQAQTALNEDQPDAAELWSALVMAMPGEAACHFGFGLALQRAQQAEMAGRHFSYACALDPSDAASAYRLGECLLALGWTSDAHDALLAAQQLCDLPHNPPHIRELSLALMQRMQ
jgi:predicted Zn-dependent protease